MLSQRLIVIARCAEEYFSDILSEMPIIYSDKVRLVFVDSSYMDIKENKPAQCRIFRLLRKLNTTFLRNGYLNTTFLRNGYLNTTFLRNGYLNTTFLRNGYPRNGHLRNGVQAYVV